MQVVREVFHHILVSLDPDVDCHSTFGCAFLFVFHLLYNEILLQFLRLRLMY